MNLTKFINEVDEIAKKYDKEKLLQIIHEVARTLPESSRNDFIQMIKNVEKSGVVSSKQKNQVLFKQQYEQWSGVLNALEEGEKCLLEEYNEAYDDWYNSSVDEILYEDPDEIGKDLDEICKFIHKCTDAEEYQYGMEIGADGVKRISDKLIIRSEVALKTSEYAITVNADRSLIEKYYVEAFRSDTNAVNYLRAFLNSANQDTCR